MRLCGENHLPGLSGWQRLLVRGTSSCSGDEGRLQKKTTNKIENSWEDQGGDLDGFKVSGYSLYYGWMVSPQIHMFRFSMTRPQKWVYLKVVLQREIGVSELNRQKGQTFRRKRKWYINEDSHSWVQEREGESQTNDTQIWDLKSLRTVKNWVHHWPCSAYWVSHRLASPQMGSQGLIYYMASLWPPGSGETEGAGDPLWVTPAHQGIGHTSGKSVSSNQPTSNLHVVNPGSVPHTDWLYPQQKLLRIHYTWGSMGKKGANKDLKIYGMRGWSYITIN